MVCFDTVELKSFHQRDAVFNICVCFDLFGPDENLEFITKKEIPRFNWIRNSPTKYAQIHTQGCMIGAILPSGMGARGVSSEHVENMEMFSCSLT